MSKKSATYEDVLDWTFEDVGEWLQQVGFYEFVEPFREKDINGKELFELSENKIRRLYPNMPTGKTDPASMLWRQINKVKENRRTKKSKIFGRGGEKRPPKAPVPDYKNPQANRQDENGSEEEDWGSDFSEPEDGPEFEQTDNGPSSQGNMHGRATSYNDSTSTSSFNNLSSSASGRDDDSSMLYLAPITDFEQTYEVPSETMNSSYGDGDCDEIYDLPHEEEDSSNSLQPDIPRRPGGRSGSPLPPVSPRHEALRPLPTLPPSKMSWQQQPGPRQAPPAPQRPSPSPHHFQRQSEIPIKQEEEQENYEVPTLEPNYEDQPNYEAPIMEQGEEEEDPEQEYLVPVDTQSMKSPIGRPPAPLPPSADGGRPPPRPAKPPELAFSSPPADEGPPPPIPTRPVAARMPIESKGFSKVLPDPPPSVVRDMLSRPPSDRRHEMSPNRPSVDENRNFGPRPPFLGSKAKVPPPLPKNIPREKEAIPENSENSGSGSGTFPLRGSTEEPEPSRLQLMPRPQMNKPELSAKPSPNKPVPSRPSWLNSNVNGNTPASIAGRQLFPTPGSDKPALPSPVHVQSPATAPPRPAARSRIPPEPPANIEAKPTPPIPTKEPLKIKKFSPHKTHPELPKQITKDLPSAAEPARTQPAPKPMPQLPKQSDMTGYPWYDADLTRDEAIQILKQTKMDGAFVVRNSSKGEGNIPYSLSLWYNNKVRNLHIRRREDGKYALGTYKENEQVFDTAVLLIQNHMTNPLILAGDAGKTCLKVAAPNFR